jgi:hypothetical protein
VSLPIDVDGIYSAIVVGGSVVLHGVITSPLWKRDVAPLAAKIEADIPKAITAVKADLAPVESVIAKDDPSLDTAIAAQLDILKNLINTKEGK